MALNLEAHCDFAPSLALAVTPPTLTYKSAIPDSLYSPKLAMEPSWDGTEEFRLQRICQIAPALSWHAKTELFNLVASVDSRPTRTESGVKQKHLRMMQIRNQHVSLPSFNLHEIAEYIINLDCPASDAASSPYYGLSMANGCSAKSFFGFISFKSVERSSRRHCCRAIHYVGMARLAFWVHDSHIAGFIPHLWVHRWQ